MVRAEAKHILKLLAIIVPVFLIGYFLEITIDELGVSPLMENTIEIMSELFSVFVALSIFTITWNAYSKSKDNHSLLLGSTFFVVGVLISFHLLSYPFMPQFITPNSEHKAAYFLIESRFILAVLFLASVYVYKDTRPKLINQYVLITSAIVLSIAFLVLTLFYHDYIFPHNSAFLGFIPEDITSTATIFMLTIITGMILYASYLYAGRAKETGQNNLIYLVDGSIIVVFSNLVYFSYEFSGHFLIITGFYFIYLALYKSSVELPYEKLAVAEGKLCRVAEERYRNLFDNASDAIVTVDHKESVTSWNLAAEKIFGWTAQEAIGKKFSDLIATQIISSGIVSGTDVVCKHRDGNDVYVSLTVSPLLDVNQKITGMSGIMRDITERKLAEEKLQQSEEKYRTLIENNQDGVVIIQDAKIQFANEAFARMAGYKVEEVIGRDFQEFIAPEDLEIVSNNYYRRQAGENIPKEYEFHMLHRDGKTRIIINMNVGLINYQGNVASMATLKDITEQKKAEELRLENVRLTLANKAKSEFLATMSHELRTPLNSIIGFSELLKQKGSGELNEKQEHYIDNVLTSGNHLLSLINGILDLTKVEAGKMELVIEKISVSSTIGETLTLLKENAERINVVLKKEFDPELEFIEADRQRFKQILFNLLSNTLKFSKPTGGTVTIITKKEGDMAKFSVSDTGIGIKKEDMDRLFKTFEQLDSGTSRNYGGTGLGLAISKKLVELHGGKIMAESKYSEGSTFTFLIPIVAKKAGKTNDESACDRRQILQH